MIRKSIWWIKWDEQSCSFRLICNIHKTLQMSWNICVVLSSRQLRCWCKTRLRLLINGIIESLLEGHICQPPQKILDHPFHRHKSSTMGMRDLGSTSLTSEQTGSFTTLYHQEDPWHHNDTSEIIDNPKWDDWLKIFRYTNDSKSGS